MRKLSFLLAILLMLTVVVSSTAAYFTDEVKGTAVVVSGNIQVLQHEQERTFNTDGTFDNLRAYTQNKQLYPSTGASYEEFTIGGYTVKMPAAPSTTYADKIVTVENVGSNPAYVRTIIAVPSFGYNSRSSETHWLRWDAYSGDAWSWSTEPVDAVVDGVEYDIYVATYNHVLTSGNTTAPSLLGVYLDGKVNFDGVNLYFPYGTKDQKIMKGSDTLEIMVATQAVQTTTFDDPFTALDEAFGKVSAANHPWCNDNLVSVSSNAQLQALLTDGVPSGTTISLESGSYTLTEELPNSIRLVGDGEVYINTPAVLTAYGVEFQNITFNNDVSFIGDGEFDAVTCKGSFTAKFTNPAYIIDCTFEAGFVYTISDEAVRSTIVIENCVGVT